MQLHAAKLRDDVIGAIERRDLECWNQIIADADNTLESLPDINYFPLHHLCETGWFEGVCAFARHSSFQKAQSRFDEMSLTPLMSAIRFKRVDITEFLLKAGADVNLHDENRIGTTALLEAAEQGEWLLCLDLLHRGADPATTGWMGKSIWDIIPPAGLSSHRGRTTLDNALKRLADR